MVGPLIVASKPPPFGPPLEISMTYNSRQESRGIFGIGWTSNLEERVQRSGNSFLYLTGSGTTVEFPAPAQPAAFTHESVLSLVPDFNPFAVKGAKDGTNLGLYVEETGWLFTRVCEGLFGFGGCKIQKDSVPNATHDQLPRVMHADGSQTLFDASGKLVARTDLVGNRQVVARTQPSGCQSLQLPTTVRLDAAAPAGQLITIDHEVSPACEVQGATVRVGPNQDRIARAVVDVGGYLTHLCAYSDSTGNGASSLRPRGGADPLPVHLRVRRLDDRPGATVDRGRT